MFILGYYFFNNTQVINHYIIIDNYFNKSPLYQIEYMIFYSKSGHFSFLGSFFQFDLYSCIFSIKAIIFLKTCLFLWIHNIGVNYIEKKRQSQGGYCLTFCHFARFKPALMEKAFTITLPLSLPLISSISLSPSLPPLSCPSKSWEKSYIIFAQQPNQVGFLPH